MGYTRGLGIGHRLRGKGCGNMEVGEREKAEARFLVPNKAASV